MGRLHIKMHSELPYLLSCASLTFTEARGNDTGVTDTEEQLSRAASHEQNTHPRLTDIDSLLCMYPFQSALHCSLPGQLCGICVPVCLCVGARFCVCVCEREIGRECMHVYKWACAAGEVRTITIHLLSICCSSPLSVKAS